MSNKDDERLRKTTIAFLKDFAEQGYENAVECIDWLEKQGEQKSIDMVEPKFHEGDWIISNYNNVAYIESISETKYNLQCKDGYHEKMSIDYIDRNWHLWTIQDAKDGDVIFYDNGWTCIFKCIHGMWYSSYCFITADGEFHIGYEEHYVGAKVNGDAHLATKEQRDTLMKAMTEAGYTFDFDKKELKKIEQNPADKIELQFEFEVGQWIVATGECVYCVAKIDGFNVTLIDVENNEYIFPIDSLNDARLWTIADAKEGDVVFYRGNVKYSDGIKYERICLFNNLNNAFFTLTKTSNYVEEYDIDVNIDYLDNTVPATKGQRDLLYVTMKEAGYEWSSEDRKLKKIGPKFHEGDWIIFYGLVVHIDEVVNGYYRTTPIDGIPCSYDWDIDNVARLWNIADAKDGDVLASDNGVIILVKESRDSSWGYRLSYHCAVLCDGTFEHREFHVNPEKFFLATKEQRDKLEKAMVNARYKWNKKKRKLEKI